MAGPVALWCALVVARAVLPWLAMGSAAADEATFSFWGAILRLMQTAEVCVGCVLVAALVHEDHVTGTTAWWMTRPISGGRLLGAKLLSAGLLLAAAPALMLSAVWMIAGFSAREVAAAAVWCVVVHGLIVTMALGAAALAENLAQFLFGSLLLVVIVFAALFGFERYLGVPPPAPLVQASEREWIVCTIVLWPAGLFVHQFLTRRRTRTAALLGVGLALVLSMGVAWTGTSRPLTRLGLGDDGIPVANSANDEAVTVAVTRVEATDADVAAKLALRVTTTGSATDSFLYLQRVRGEWQRTGKPGEFTVYYRQKEPAIRPDEHAAMTIAGETPKGGAALWTVSRDAPPASNTRPQEKPVGFRGVVWLRSMRGRLLGELPAKPGATLHAGSSLTRIVEFKHVEEKTFLVLEERDALPMCEYWLDTGRMRGRPGEVEDAYVLIDQANSRAELLEPGTFDALVARAMATGQRWLEVPAWAEGATLRKVRFEAERIFSRPLAIERWPGAAEEKQP